MNNGGSGFSESEISLLWLAGVPGLGPKRISALLEAFGEPSCLLSATREELLSVPGLFPSVVDAMLKNKDVCAQITYARELKSKCISFTTLCSADYPPILSLICDPPPVLYYKGELPDFTNSVAIIGSRRCSEYGSRVTETLACELASRGVTIVSGMAKGIDSFAHKGALSGNGKTAAVLGSGVDVCYPSENRSVYEKITKTGCVISEYPPGTKPAPGNFPARNRIISGLSKAVIVVEAALKSGTLITVDMALEQGRDVFAVPGNITSKLSGGTNALIKQGAYPLITDYTDVLNVLNIKYDSGDNRKQNTPVNKPLAPEEELIYDCVDFSPTGIEELAHKVKMPVTQTGNICSALEIKGLIKKLPGLRFIRA